MSVHKDLTGADLHEPKGADTATSGKVYVSDGAGSGAWTTASDIITNTAFTTGDLKPTHKATADTGWIIWSDGTIGDASSAASIRANADTSDLFSLYWTNYSNPFCPVYTSAGVASTRGASAAADYAAHKRIAVPVGAGRVLGIAGTGSGLTARLYGTVTGAETVVLVTANLPAYTPTGTISGTITYPTSVVTVSSGGVQQFLGSGGSSTFGTVSGTTAVTATFTGTAQGGTSTGVSIVQPSAFHFVMIKL